MKLSEQAIERIKETKIRMRIAVALGFSDQHFHKAILANKKNGLLTKISVIKVIEQETGLTQDEILTESVDTIPAQST